MRELDFSEENLFSRWLGVKSIWSLIQGEVKKSVKVTLERALTLETEAQVGCGRYEHSAARRDHRNGSYVRSLLTQYGWIDDLRVPRLRASRLDSQVFARYQRR
ncbi:MAG: transposase, partial [bacterium]|nr:transposase [bacterium]